MVQLVTVMLVCSKVSHTTLGKNTKLNDAIDDLIFARGNPN